MYFSRYIKPEYKEKLFKQWDSLGKAEYDSLKLFGVEDDIVPENLGQYLRDGWNNSL